ncbi:MAG TPA: helix-turn-helix domain-containing protein [Solirubrobacterales bacterium]|nr:helix-turn-helix domain-containing protein [Solirubrobacterales bacterium]
MAPSRFRPDRGPGAGLASRLYLKSPEIAATALARAHAVGDPAEVGDPSYAAGLREAIGAGLAYGIAAIEGTAERSAPPAKLLAQARSAARYRVPIDVVLRRYFAGYTLLGDCILEAAEESRVPNAQLRRVLRGQALLFDALLVSVADEYRRETEDRRGDVELRRTRLVQMLLAGEVADPRELRYELDAWHLGAIAAGPGAVGAMRELAATLDRTLLLVRPEEAGTLWAWLGGRSPLSASETLSQAERRMPHGTSLALGEPGRGLEGWRFTHRQAKAAMAVVQCGPTRAARYGEVGLLAAALRDEVLAGSLRELYLSPLEEQRGASTLVETLHAYFAAGRNASSAAAALGVSRKTVSIRLSSVEERLGTSLNSCAAEVQTALSLRELDRSTLP